MAAITSPGQRGTLESPVVRTGLFLLIPLLALVTAGGAYVGKEGLVLTAWVGAALLTLLFVHPTVGIVTMVSGFLMGTYPEIVRGAGVFTLNNLLGLGFGTLLVSRWLQTRDFSFLRLPQVQLFLAIGVVFLISSAMVPYKFPTLQVTRGITLILDRTGEMTHIFISRLVFLIFFVHFVRTRADIQLTFATVMFTLFLAIPSALYNAFTGDLIRGFRATADLSSGSNPNRLAMMCLMEMGMWWLYARAKSTPWRRLGAAIVIPASLLTLLMTGSRSGLLGLMLLVGMTHVAPREYRPPWAMMFIGGILASFLIAVAVPQEAWKRATNFFPTAHHEAGASSNEKREATINTGLQMIREHPVLGVGLGNFREVARQIYRDEFFRPPHNSYLWAAAEGGLICLALYLWLFRTTWRHLTDVGRFSAGDPDMAWLIMALRMNFVFVFFFGLFADLWLHPVTYITLALSIAVRLFYARQGV
jgi:O-antigen ligase